MIEELVSQILRWSIKLQQPVDKATEKTNFKMYNEVLNQLGSNVRQLDSQLVADMNENPFRKVTLKHEGYKNVYFIFDFEQESLQLPQISSLKVDLKGDQSAPSFEQISGGLRYSQENAQFTVSADLKVEGFFLEEMKVTGIQIEVEPPFFWWK